MKDINGKEIRIGDTLQEKWHCPHRGNITRKGIVDMEDGVLVVRYGVQSPINLVGYLSKDLTGKYEVI